MNFTDAVGFLVRDTIRQAFGLPDNYVRPANQNAPAGNISQSFATVLLSSVSSSGWPNLTVTPDGHGALTYALEAMKEFMASVQFFKAANEVDAEGIATQSDGGFDLALRLPDVLQLPATRYLLNQRGLGFVRVEGEPHNLTALVDTLWESRGHVDLRFNVVNREAATVAILQAVNIELFTAQPGGYTDQHMRVST